jgi:hypothetical protein
VIAIENFSAGSEPEIIEKKTQHYSAFTIPIVIAMLLTTKTFPKASPFVASGSGP